MKKHLWGFALFNLIVGTAMIVAILTGNFPRPATRYVYEVSNQSCWRGVRQNAKTRKEFEISQDSIKVTQAVLNEKTGKLDMTFANQSAVSLTKDVVLKLTFVNMTSKGSNNWKGNVKTEFVTLSPYFSVNINNGVYGLPLSYKWLNESKKKENLYVKAEIADEFSTNLETVSRKDNYDDFTPVLLMNNK